jgi:long-chain fatty acid transport protein
LGTAFAGGAAIAEDASTVWYNPAGMIRFDRPQLVVAASYIDLNIKTNAVSASTVQGTPLTGGAGKAPGQNALLPSLYYVHPLSKDFALGAGINAPFGLTTEYDSTWAGRYHAVKSEIKTINFNFGGAYKINDVWSAGAGVNYQKLNAELSQAVDFATLCNLVGAGGVCGGTGGTNDGFAKVTADSNAWGYNLGVLAQLPNDFRVGLAYRSSMKQSLSGNFDITVPGNVPPPVTGGLGLVNSGAKTDVTLPSSVSVSFYQQIDKWALMADLTKTNWSSLQELRIRFDSNQQNSVVTLNLKDTWRYSVGATYKLSDAWTLRGGLALDQTPVQSAADTTPRLPDADRTWYAIGAGWQMSRSLAFDFGYVLIKVDDAQVRKVATPTNENLSRGNLSVDYSGSTIQVFSAQARYTF